jgi:hypothetical protein
MKARLGSHLFRVFPLGIAPLFMATADGQNRTFSFAYDQPTTTAYGIAGNIFDAELKEVSVDGRCVEHCVAGRRLLAALHRPRPGHLQKVSQKEVHSMDDIKGMKARAGDQDRGRADPGLRRATVHMPFGDVYTSLQTGVVNVAQNRVNALSVRDATARSGGRSWRALHRRC